MAQLVECVPNVSEGRDRTVIDAIAGEIRRASGVTLLDVDSGADTNRTVYTFVGSPESVRDAAFRMAQKVAALVDMSTHTGAHPRIGALDVLPIVPVSDVTMEECVEVARTLGQQIADDLQIPVYFYEHAATRQERHSLADIRAGEYEGLLHKLADPAWTPDCGPAVFNPRLGATVVGAREFLVAYNVNLNTRDRRLAQEIALRIRETGRLARDADGNVVTGPDGRPARTPGRLPATRAIGWYLEAYRQAQVSINLLNVRTTPLHVAFETVREEAERLGALVTGSELVGLVPLQVLLEAGRHYLRKQRKSSGAPDSELLEIAIQSLGLNALAPFEPQKRIIEYAVRPERRLLTLSVARFLDEVSSSAPAPGGGSAAALAGSLGAALAAMVANLTVGRPGHESADAELSALAERAQAARSALADLVDEDTRAFDAVMQARRMPRGSEAERHARDVALRAALRHATEVPLRAARLSLDALELARSAAREGRSDAASDAGAAALLSRAGLESAVLNVLINLPAVDDEGFAQACRVEVERLRSLGGATCEEVVQRIHGMLNAQAAAR